MGLSDTARFLAAFLRNPARVGAIAPSSAALARSMVRGVRVEAGQSVVEFGPGTGPFTEALRQTLGDPAAYLGIEREQRFVDLLNRRFPGMRFVCASAENAARIHADAALGPVRAVISGLPFASLPAPVQDGIMDAIDHLLPAGGEFRTFQYVHAFPLPAAVRFRRRMDKLFGRHTRSAPTLLNLPPAFVLTWRRG